MQPPGTPRTLVVVPCFNEARRLDTAAFAAHAAAAPGTGFCFVDDGSTDGTWGLLAALPADGPLTARRLARNVGKGEAVRAGLRHAIAAGAERVGYWDADLATPLGELPRMAARLDADPTLEGVLGARVRLLGRRIDRRALRHYPGRVIATLISLALGYAVYDTQCGAKLFRVTDRLRRALDAPFTSRWLFDVELLMRLGERGRGLEEVPLARWRDVDGSKLTAGDGLRAVVDLARLWRRYPWPA